MNPKARYQIETPLEEVMNAEMISYPNTKLMCSVNVDGAAAAILVSEKKAKELGMARAVKVRASILTSDPYQERDLVMPDVNSCTRKAAKEAYEMAGLGADDIDSSRTYMTVLQQRKCFIMKILGFVEMEKPAG